MNMQESPLSDAGRAQAAELEDRRKWSRIPDEAGSQVRFSTKTQNDRQAQLVEAAVGGFAIKVDDPLDLQPGQEAMVRFNEGTIRAVVRYIRPENDSTYRVGLEWVHPKSVTVISVLRRCLEG